MRKFLIALAVVGGVGIAAGSVATAAPLSTSGSGAGLNVQGSVQGLFTPVQYGGGGYYGGGGGHGYRHRRHCYYVQRCSGYYPYQRCWKERVCD